MKSLVSKMVMNFGMPALVMSLLFVGQGAFALCAKGSVTHTGALWEMNPVTNTAVKIVGSVTKRAVQTNDSAGKCVIYTDYTISAASIPYANGTNLYLGLAPVPVVNNAINSTIRVNRGVLNTNQNSCVDIIYLYDISSAPAKRVYGSGCL